MAEVFRDSWSRKNITQSQPRETIGFGKTMQANHIFSFFNIILRTRIIGLPHDTGNKLRHKPGPCDPVDDS